MFATDIDNEYSTCVMDDEKADGPAGICTVQDSLDNVVFEGTVKECQQYYNDEADWTEAHYIFDEDERCWKMSPNGFKFMD